MTRQKRAVTEEEINAALRAEKVDSEICLKDGTIQRIEGNSVTPFGEVLVGFAGKILKRDFSVVRGGRQVLFKASTKWEEIPAHYKAGFSKINFPVDIFE